MPDNSILYKVELSKYSSMMTKSLDVTTKINDKHVKENKLYVICIKSFIMQQNCSDSRGKRKAVSHVTSPISCVRLVISQVDPTYNGAPEEQHWKW